MDLSALDIDTDVETADPLDDADGQTKDEQGNELGRQPCCRLVDSRPRTVRRNREPRGHEHDADRPGVSGYGETWLVRSNLRSPATPAIWSGRWKPQVRRGRRRRRCRR